MEVLSIRTFWYAKLPQFFCPNTITTCLKYQKVTACTSYCEDADSKKIFLQKDFFYLSLKYSSSKSHLLLFCFVLFSLPSLARKQVHAKPNCTFSCSKLCSAFLRPHQGISLAKAIQLSYSLLKPCRTQKWVKLGNLMKEQYLRDNHLASTKYLFILMGQYKN